MTGLTPPPPPPDRFSSGKVISLTFAIYFRNFFAFFLMAFVVNLPALLMQFDAVSTVGEQGSLFDIGEILASLLNLLLSYVVTGAILFGVYQQMRGEPFSMGRALGFAGNRVVAILVVSILSGLLVGVGFIVFIIPGIILYLVLLVAVPATVVERVGPLDALSRSAELTKGHRLELFGLLILFGALMLAIVSIPTFILGMNMRTDPGAGWVIAWHAFSVAVGLIQSVFLGVVYYELRRTKEGLDLEQLASNFDQVSA